MLGLREPRSLKVDGKDAGPRGMKIEVTISLEVGEETAKNHLREDSQQGDLAFLAMDSVVKFLNSRGWEVEGLDATCEEIE